LGKLQKVRRPCCAVFCYSNLEQGLSGDRKTRYSRKSGHGHPDEGLAGTRDKWCENRDVPVKSGTGGSPSVVPYVDISLHRGQFLTRSTASFSVRLAWHELTNYHTVLLAMCLIYSNWNEPYLLLLPTTLYLILFFPRRWG